MSEKTTKVEKGSFNGRPTISVWEVDPAGNKVGKAPIVSFGITKAKEIVKHIDEVKSFLSENGYKQD